MLILSQLVAVELELMVLVLDLLGLILLSTVRLEVVVAVVDLVLLLEIQVDAVEEELTQAQVVEQVLVLLVDRIMLTLLMLVGEILVLQVVHREVVLVVALVLLVLLDEVPQVEQDYHLV